jgi:flagellar assembly protein FliH
MASVIKAGRIIPSGTSVQHSEFNLEDMSQHASKYLDNVKQKAAQLVRDAQQQSQRIKSEAAQEGRQAAVETAQEAALQELESRWSQLAPALQQAIAAADQERAAWVRQWEKHLVHLVVAISQRVIRRELSGHPEITQQWIREALELASGSNRITLHLHPDDYTSLATFRDELRAEFSKLVDADIVEDADVSPGGCRVETEYGHIDQQIEAQLARIEEELTT